MRSCKKYLMVKLMVKIGSSSLAFRLLGMSMLICSVFDESLLGASGWKWHDSLCSMMGYG